MFDNKIEIMFDNDCNDITISSGYDTTSGGTVNSTEEFINLLIWYMKEYGLMEKLEKTIESSKSE